MDGLGFLPANWLWFLLLGDHNPGRNGGGPRVTGQAATKAEAVAEAERAVDKAWPPKKLKLIRP
jgi:hypothetical protein